jgi:demethylmenaquinone methyltransferase/2-methoxy-6-polyprenyl-1,4-benzoquinol methylase
MMLELSGLAGPCTRIIGADFSMPMLDIAIRKPYRVPVVFTLADVGMLPFREAAFDRVTLCFATRNLNSDRETLVRTFREFRRVLKPGGRFVNLETTGIRSRPLRTLVRVYLEGWVKRLGGRISGSRPAYAYLSGSIGTFYTAGELDEILLEAGFSSVIHKRLLTRVVAVHAAAR